MINSYIMLLWIRLIFLRRITELPDQKYNYVQISNKDRPI